MPPQRAIHAPREAEIRETDQLELCLRDGSGELMQEWESPGRVEAGGRSDVPVPPTADAQPIVNGDSAFLPHFYHTPRALRACTARVLHSWTWTTARCRRREGPSLARRGGTLPQSTRSLTLPHQRRYEALIILDSICVADALLN